MIAPLRPVRLFLDQQHLLRRVVTIGISPASIAWQVMGYDPPDVPDVVIVQNLRTQVISRAPWREFQGALQTGALVCVDTRTRQYRVRTIAASPIATPKRCQRCQQPSTDFGRNRNQPDGRHAVCRGCRKVERAQGLIRRQARLALVGRVA